MVLVKLPWIQEPLSKTVFLMRNDFYYYCFWRFCRSMGWGSNPAMLNDLFFYDNFFYIKWRSIWFTGVPLGATFWQKPFGKLNTSAPWSTPHLISAYYSNSHGEYQTFKSIQNIMLYILFSRYSFITVHQTNRDLVEILTIWYYLHDF